MPGPQPPALGNVDDLRGAISRAAHNPPARHRLRGSELQAASACASRAGTRAGGTTIFDVSNPREPEFLTAVPTDCGSHTHTIVPDLGNDCLLIYVSSYALGAAAIGPNCAAPTAASPVSHDKISIVEVPLGEPREAAVINEPSGMFQDGQVCTPTAGNPLVPGDSDFICNPTDDETRPFASRGCHDIQVLADARLAACSALAEGQLWDISDPEEPRLIKRVDNPNVEFWHNASFTYDGRVVAFSDEAGGGVGRGASRATPTPSAPTGSIRCRATRRRRSATSSPRAPRRAAAPRTTATSCRRAAATSTPRRGTASAPRCRT